MAWLDSSGFSGFRIVRTLENVDNPANAVLPYSEQKKIEDLLPGPESCETEITDIDTPVLSFVNPFPVSKQIKPLQVVDGQLWYTTEIGPMAWPAIVPPVDYTGQQSSNVGDIQKAWDTLWIGNSSGGIWQARDYAHTWQDVTEESGGIPWSMTYDSARDKLLGWFSCDLFIHGADGHSEVRHYYENVFDPSGNKQKMRCRLGEYLARRDQGHIASFNGQTYLTLEADSDDGGRNMALIRIDGPDMNEFEQLCEIPLNYNINFYYGEPHEFDGKLLLPGIPGQIWAFDGSTCSLLIEDATLNNANAPLYMASLGDELFIASNYDLFSYSDGTLNAEWNGEGDIHILGLAADAGHNVVYAGGTTVYDDHGMKSLNSFVIARAPDGNWHDLKRNIFDNGTFDLYAQPLTTVAFGTNGKGLAGGRKYDQSPTTGPIMRYDGCNWYPWTEKHYETAAVTTIDGDTAWLATRSKVYRISDAEGVIEESIPNTKGRFILNLLAFGDEIWAMGEWGLLWHRNADGEWEEIETGSDLNFFDGVKHTGQVYLSAGVTYNDGGTELYRLNGTALENVTVPPYPEDFYSGNEGDMRNLSMSYSFMQYHMHVIHLLSKDGHLYMARNDGVWQLEASDTWRQLLDDSEGRDGHVMSLDSCGDAICRTMLLTRSTERNDSWMDILDCSGGSECTVWRRNMLLSYQGHPVLDAAPIGHDRLVLVGGHGLIMEYGKALQTPCERDYMPEFDFNEYADTFDEEAFFGDCESTQEQETPTCQDGMCYIPDGSYCIGATRQADNRGLAQADEYPATPIETESFLIDQKLVTRAQYTAFIIQHPYVEWPEYLSFDIENEYYKGLYGLTISEEGGISAQLDSNPVEFATLAGAEAYCESTGKRLCNAAEWEMACRGHDDQPYLAGKWLPSDKLEKISVSDFGVESMGTGYYEYTSDFYHHDSLRHPEGGAPENALPMMKGGSNDDRDRSCWGRSQAYFMYHPRKLSFRCCKD